MSKFFEGFFIVAMCAVIAVGWVWIVRSIGGFMGLELAS